MSATFAIRQLLSSDLAAADGLRVQAGWNQTAADWQDLLDLQPAGCFVAERHGRIVGVITTTPHGAGVGWVGMLLVDSEHRRRGIGHALLDRAIRHLRAAGIRCIKLDATPQGRELYQRMGFAAEWTLTRWTGAAPARAGAPRAATIRDWIAADATAVETIDCRAFGTSRDHLLARLARRSSAAVIAWTAAATSEPAAYGMIRPGSLKSYLGPVAAASASAGESIIRELLRRAAGQALFWDIPDANAAAIALAQESGFERVRPLTRMALGERFKRGSPSHYFAIAGPEIG